VTNGELVEDEEENPENQDIELVIDEMIDELSNEIIPRGEELLNDPEEEELDETIEDGDPVEQLLRPRRETREPDRLTYSQIAQGVKQDRIQMEHKHNLFQQSVGKERTLEYREDECLVVARFLDDIQQKFGFGQQHTLEKGLRKFGDQGVQATEKEIGQLHDRECFKPVKSTR
jgi:hypothetical protein